MTIQLKADHYAELIASARVRERGLFLPLRTPTELELQARWFAGDFGQNFVSTSGDKIDIVQFGTWNREAGPDFRDAAIRVNGVIAWSYGKDQTKGTKTSASSNFKGSDDVISWQ
jgi:hypothetical protein